MRGVERSSLTARAALLMAAKTAAFGLTMFLPLVLVRQLSAGDFGLYKQVFLVVATASTLPLNFALSAFYFWPREPEKRGALVLNIALFYGLTTGAAGLALALSPGLLESLFHDPQMVDYRGAIGAIVLLWGATSFLETIVIANGETRLAAGFIVTLQLTKVVFLLGAVLWRPTFGALVAAAVAQGLMQLALTATYLSSRFDLTWRQFDMALLKRQLAYILPLGVAGWLYAIQLEAPSYVVAHHFDAATFAIYAVGCFQLPLVGILSDAVGSVAVPEINRLRQAGRIHDIVTLTARMTRKLAAVYLPVYAFLIVTRHEFISLLFTDRYAGSVPIFAVYLTLMPLAIVSSATNGVIRAYPEALGFLIRFRVAVAALALPAMWLATMWLGPIGAVLAVVLAMLVDHTGVALKSGRLLDMKWDLSSFKDVPKLALASAGAGVAAWLVRHVLLPAPPLGILIGSGLVFVLVYVAGVLALDVLDPGDREAVRRRTGRLQMLATRWRTD